MYKLYDDKGVEIYSNSNEKQFKSICKKLSYKKKYIVSLSIKNKEIYRGQLIDTFNL